MGKRKEESEKWAKEIMGTCSSCVMVLINNTYLRWWGETNVCAVLHVCEVLWSTEYFRYGILLSAELFQISWCCLGRKGHIQSRIIARKTASKLCWWYGEDLNGGSDLWTLFPLNFVFPYKFSLQHWFAERNRLSKMQRRLAGFLITGDLIFWEKAASFLP